MKKDICILIQTLIFVLAISSNSHALSTLYVLEDNLEQKVKVWFEDVPNSPEYEETYIGEALDGGNYLSSGYISFTYEDRFYSRYASSRFVVENESNNSFFMGSLWLDYEMSDVATYSGNGLSEISWNMQFLVEGDDSILYNARPLPDGEYNLSLYDATIRSFVDPHTANLEDSHIYDLEINASLRHGGDPNQVFSVYFENSALVAVPEPYSLVAFFLGIGSFICLRRRRSNA